MYEVVSWHTVADVADVLKVRFGKSGYSQTLSLPCKRLNLPIFIDILRCYLSFSFLFSLEQTVQFYGLMTG